jgi:hypothetical protein
MPIPLEQQVREMSAYDLQSRQDEWKAFLFHAKANHWLRPLGEKLLPLLDAEIKRRAALTQKDQTND